MITYDAHNRKANLECKPYSIEENNQEAEYEEDGEQVGPAYFEWCYLCESKGPHWNFFYYFYPDVEKNQCTLQLVTGRSVTLDAKDDGTPGYPPPPCNQPCSILNNNSMETLITALRNPLDSFFGVGSALMTCDESRESGCAFWTNTLGWKKEHEAAYLYCLWDYQDDVLSGAVEFLWRKSPLLKLQNTIEKQWEINIENIDNFLYELPYQACHDAGIKNCSSSLTSPELIEQALNVAIAHLKTVSSASKEYPALAYWIDKLLYTLIAKSNETTFARWDAKNDELRSIGIEFFKNDNRNYYSRTLLHDIAINHQDSPWGQKALLEMISLGWIIGMNRTGHSFKTMIEQGEKFLKNHPDSEITPTVIFYVAKAYETLWSLSKSGYNRTTDEETFSSKNAEQARVRAIMLYKKYLATKTSLTSNQQLLLKLMLLRLQQDIDTAGRAF